MLLTKTTKVKLYLDSKNLSLVIPAMQNYIAAVNYVVDKGASGIDVNKWSSATIRNEFACLPSALRADAVRQAKSILRVYNKRLRKSSNTRIPILRRFVYRVNNQNFKVKRHGIEFPVIINGKSKRIFVKARMPREQYELLQNAAKLGTMTICFKGSKIVAIIPYFYDSDAIQMGKNTMGVDLGIKCPAVSVCSDGTVKFHGNGRYMKYLRRKYHSRRQKLQKQKKLNVVKRTSDKEHRVMTDINHKISRDIVNTAVKHDVSVIKLENLTGIRSKTRASRKNNRSLHSWPFAQLISFIEYKAAEKGIRVEFVNPAYTSQTCPCCGKRNKVSDRSYSCGCGFKSHRDLVGARNILESTEYVGNRRAA